MLAGSIERLWNTVQHDRLAFSLPASHRDLRILDDEHHTGSSAPGEARLPRTMGRRDHLGRAPRPPLAEGLARARDAALACLDPV